MEPFSILCRSCAARLKVTNASAVGQVLACPKCGTMINVVAPAGWVAPEPENGISASDMSSGQLGDSVDVHGANFDDIEHILSNFDLCRSLGAFKHAEQREQLRPENAAKTLLNLYRKINQAAPHPLGETSQ